MAISPAVPAAECTGRATTAAGGAGVSLLLWQAASAKATAVTTVSRANEPLARRNDCENKNVLITAPFEVRTRPVVSRAWTCGLVFMYAIVSDKSINCNGTSQLIM